MNTPDRDDVELLEVLHRHPTLKRRVEGLADIVADSDGDLACADEAERRVSEEVRRLEGEALRGWAAGRIERTGEEASQAPETGRAGRVAAGDYALAARTDSDVPNLGIWLLGLADATRRE
jgi:hypothetical protein